MGREIRRVPPNLEHPRYTKDTARNQRDIGEYMPMHDETFEETSRKWKEGYAAWEAGTHESLSYYREQDRDTQYWEYDSPPDRELCRPAFTEEPTWFQVYQTVSEGTPVTPPFATREELVEYLIDAIGKGVNMDKPISVGDLVVVLRGQLCCGGTGASVGAITTVSSIRSGRLRCEACNDVVLGTGAFCSNGLSYDIRRLKRIPPFADLDGKKDAADKPITLDGQIERLRKLVRA